MKTIALLLSSLLLAPTSFSFAHTKPDNLATSGHRSAQITDSEFNSSAINIALELEPNDLLWRDRKAAILSKSKKYLEAIARYTDLIQTKPAADAYNTRGISKSALGNKEGAIGDYDKALAIDPQLAQAYYNRGIVKFSLSQYSGRAEAVPEAPRSVASPEGKGWGNTDYAATQITCVYTVAGVRRIGISKRSLTEDPYIYIALSSNRSMYYKSK
jgi:tetratricopeptide (TPR) repeat protein